MPTRTFRAVIAALRHQGHDVAWILEDAPGSPDPEVLARAQREGRVLVTFDKDFGELAFHRGLAASVGVETGGVFDPNVGRSTS